MTFKYRHPKRKLTDKQAIELRVFYKGGVSLLHLAQMYKISSASVLAIVRNITYNDSPKRRYQSDEQVRDIRTRHAAGEKCEDLAREYLLKTETVCRCIKRETYKDIE